MQEYTARRGHRYLRPEYHEYERNGTLALSRITLRRAEVLRGLADGRTEREIAELLGLEVASVRSHVAQLKMLTGYKSVRELGRWWRLSRVQWLLLLGSGAGVDMRGSLEAPDWEAPD